MPKIEQYDAPTTRLRPSETGVDAFTRAGRYEGQYYRQIAQDTRDLGVVQNQEIRQRGWPFDILALESEAFKNAGRGVGFKTSGGGKDEDPFGQFSQKPLGRIAGSGRDDPPEYNPLASHGQASRGAGALGRAARGLSGRGGTRPEVAADFGGPGGHGGFDYHNETIDTRTGLPIGSMTPGDNRVAALANTKYNKDRASMADYNTQAGIAADRAANQAQNWYRNAEGDPTAGIPTGYTPPPAIPGEGTPIDQYGNPLGGDPSTGSPAPDQYGDPVPPATPDAVDLRNWMGGGDNPDVTEGREDIQ